tara:strand:+ start:8135 stop:9220 length:1086 start_codon:yes stop_codon:yes gene_type:complete
MTKASFRDWQMAQQVLKQQLDASRSWQMSAFNDGILDEGDTISDAIEFYLSQWRGFLEDEERWSPWKVSGVFSFVNPEAPRGLGGASIGLLRLKHYLEKNALSNNMVLWAFSPMSMAEGLAEYPQDLTDLVEDLYSLTYERLRAGSIDWPLYYMVTTDMPQSFDTEITVDGHDISALMPYAMGFDHWGNIQKVKARDMLLSPDVEGVGLPGTEWLLGRRVNMAAGKMTKEYVASGGIGQVLRFLKHGHPLFKKAPDGSRLIQTDFTWEKPPHAFAKHNISSRPNTEGMTMPTINSLLALDAQPHYQVLEDRHGELVMLYNTVNPIFAIVLTGKRHPNFQILNWRTDNLITLFPYMMMEEIE